MQPRWNRAMTDRTILCQEDGPPLTDRAGNAIPNFISNSPYFTQFGFSQVSPTAVRTPS